MVYEIETTKTVMDVISGALAIGTLAQTLPMIAAVASIAWSVIRIGEWAYKKWKLHKLKKPN